jgi:tRNA_anti-like
MRRILFFCIGMLLLCCVIWGVFKAMRPHQGVEGQPAIASISSSNLYHDFATSETVANKKWVGNIIEVSGTISSVTKSGDHASISLAATTDGGINCSMSKKETSVILKLKNGESVSLKGRCTGFLMDVNMVDCIIIIDK